jgi:hypothetical protein
MRATPALPAEDRLTDEKMHELPREAETGAGGGSGGDPAEG